MSTIYKARDPSRYLVVTGPSIEEYYMRVDDDGTYSSFVRWGTGGIVLHTRNKKFDPKELRHEVVQGHLIELPIVDMSSWG